MDFRRKTAIIAALMALACLVQAWTIARAVVPAQDAVRYLIVAQGFWRDGFTATLRTQPEQPLFPALASLTHRALTALGWTDADDWAISMQATAGVALVLSVVPVYLLFCMLHGARSAVTGTLLYCVLGGIARLGADGLSDSTHLALFMAGLWCAARYFTVPQPRFAAGWLLACGVFTGLALATRGESLVLPAAILATLGCGWLRERTFQRWRQTACAATAFSVGLAIVLAPYLASCGATTLRAASERLVGRGGAAEAAPLNDFSAAAPADAVEPRWELPGVGRLAFGKKDTSTSSRFHGYWSAAAKLTHELAQSLHYWIGVLALVGLWTARKRLTSPLDRFMQGLCAALVLVGVWLAAHAGYLSTRHVLLLVVLALGWAGFGSYVVGKWLERNAAARHASGFVAAVVALACAADCLAPLHASREAHRQAAGWLADHAERSVAVLDSRGWTAFYTGRKTYRYEAAQAAFCDPTLAYVVVEQAELASDSRRGETMRLLMDHAGEPVARFAAADSEKHGVAVYRWRPERFQQLGVQTYAR